MRFRISRLHDSKQKLNMMASVEVDVAMMLHSADNLVKLWANCDDSTNMTYIDVKTRCVTGDGWVVLVEQLGE